MEPPPTKIEWMVFKSICRSRRELSIFSINSLVCCFISFCILSLKTVGLFCNTASIYISDVMNAIANAGAEDFDFEALEKWLKEPKKMVKTVCEFITNRNSSDYNESICDFINQV